MGTISHDQAWPGLAAPHLPFPTQGLSRPGGQAFLATTPLSAPPRPASAPELQPPPLSPAPKNTVSLFWVTTRHAQGISIIACGASDSLRPLTQLTPSGPVPSAPAPWAAPHPAWDPQAASYWPWASQSGTQSQPLAHWSPQGPLIPIICTETPAPKAHGTNTGAALG